MSGRRMCLVLKLLSGGMGSKMYTSLLVIIHFPSFRRLYGNYHEFIFHFCLLTVYTLVKSNVTSLYCQLKLKIIIGTSRWHLGNFRKSCHHQWLNSKKKKSMKSSQTGRPTVYTWLKRVA